MKPLSALFPPETEPARLARGVSTGPMNSVVITTVLIPGIRLGSAVPRLYLSARAKPAALLPRVATGMGRLLAALRSRCISLVLRRFFHQRAFSGRHGAVHFRFDAADARLLSFPLVRRRGWCRRRHPRTSHVARTHRERRCFVPTCNPRFGWAWAWPRFCCTARRSST